jgi:hypothetical protein
MVWFAGTIVRRAGIYSVTHRSHRPTHPAILQTGDLFPLCRMCGTAVRFDFAQPLTESDEIEHIGYDPDFMESVLQLVPKSA